MILSHTHRFIFICSSKVGTTSMEEVLRPMQEGPVYDFGSAGLFPPKHVPPALLRATLPDRIWNEYFKFVFVRNPWDWLVSQWCYNPQDSGADVRASAGRGGGVLRRSVRGVTRGRQRSASPDADVDLQPPPVGDEVVRLRVSDVDALFALLKPFRGLPGRDGLYQANWVYDMDGRQLVDYIGRFETLDADFAHVCERLSLNLRLPHRNRTGHRDYRSYYSDEARERVGELWEIDVRSFGYDFDGRLRP